MLFVQATDKRGNVCLHNTDKSSKICLERDGNKFAIVFYSKAPNSPFKIFYEDESKARQNFESLMQCLAKHHVLWESSGNSEH